MTLEQVSTRFEAETGVPLTRGGLSAIENGIRGVSTATLAGLEAAYGLNQGEITTAYEPKPSSPSSSVCKTPGCR